MHERPRVERILLVDDDVHARQVAEGHLEAAGYAVTIARDGFEALELFARRRPDLVMLDVLMPGMDGLQTCHRIRQLEGGTEVPILMVTAIGDLAPHLESAADDYLPKPLQRTDLLARVASLLAIRRLRQELRDGRERILAQEEELTAIRQRREELVVLAVHDMKRPLSRVLAVSEALLAASPDPAFRAGLEEIHASAAGIRRLVFDLLEVTRGEAGALVLRPRPLDLSALIAELAPNVTVGRPGARVQRDLPPLHVQGDRDLLARVFENLLHNAVEYAPEGTAVTVRGEARDGVVEVRVSDQGPGIPAAVRERVFTRFSELERADQLPQRVGHGLGLVYCRYVLNLHGGVIAIEDNRPRGTTFVVRLPADPDAPSRPAG